MKKFYTFRVGQIVPKWMFDFKCDDVDMHQNKHGKFTFGRSVIAVRQTGEQTKLMPATEGDYYIKCEGFNNAKIGGVNRGSGVCIRSDDIQSGFGKGLTYTISK